MQQEALLPARAADGFPLAEVASAQCQHPEQPWVLLSPGHRGGHSPCSASNLAKTPGICSSSGGPHGSNPALLGEPQEALRNASSNSLYSLITRVKDTLSLFRA